MLWKRVKPSWEPKYCKYVVLGDYAVRKYIIFFYLAEVNQNPRNNRKACWQPLLEICSQQMDFESLHLAWMPSNTK